MGIRKELKPEQGETLLADAEGQPASRRELPTPRDPGFAAAFFESALAGADAAGCNGSYR